MSAANFSNISQKLYLINPLSGTEPSDGTPVISFGANLDLSSSVNPSDYGWPELPFYISIDKNLATSEAAYVYGFANSSDYTDGFFVTFSDGINVTSIRHPHSSGASVVPVFSSECISASAPPVPVVGSINIDYIGPDFDNGTTVGDNTWTRPNENVSVIEVWICGGGGAGGSGHKATAGANYGEGGGGGAGAELIYAVLDGQALSGPQTVTIGSGGTGGAAITGSSSDGNPGSDGDQSTFGALITARGGVGGSAGNSSVQTNQLAAENNAPGGELGTGADPHSSGLPSQIF